MPDDYFCPGCGNYSQKEPGSCPLCRTPLATLGDEASSVNDYALENDDLFEDDPGTRNSVAVHGQPRLHDKKDSFEDEDQDL